MGDKTGNTATKAEIELLTYLADLLAPPLLVEWAAQNAHLFKGFGLKTRNAPHFRSLLRRHLLKTEKLPEPTRLLLARGSLNVSVAAVLSEEALEYCLEEFCAFYGRKNFLAALVVDRRTFVHDLAVKHAEKSLEEAAGEAKSAAPALLKAKLEPFLNEIDELISQPLAFDPQTGEETLKLLAAYDKIAQLEEEAALGRSSTLKGVRDKLQSSESRVIELEEEAAKSKKALAKERQTAQVLSSEVESLRRELVARTETEGKLLDEAVSRELSNALRPWLERPLLVEEAVKTPKAGELGARVEAALERQAKVDRHQGNRAALSAERANLATLLKRVESARREAIKPLPELRELSEALKGELRRIDELLGEGSALETHPLVAELTARINEAKSFEEVEELKEGLEGLQRAGLATSSDLPAVYAALHNRVTRLVDEYPADSQPRPEGFVQGLAFRKALAGREPYLLLVDGHNVLHLLKRLFEPYYEHGRPGGVARDRLLALVDALVSRTATGRGLVFFDSPISGVKPHSTRVEICYSGGGAGEGRADQAMLAKAGSFASREGQTHLLAVTSDRELRRNLAKFCTATATSEEFEQFIARF